MGVLGWVDGGDGGQRASFGVDRSGGLYQNNRVVNYFAKRRSKQKHVVMFFKGMFQRMKLFKCSGISYLFSF